MVTSLVFSFLSETKELCEARVNLEMSSNFQIYLGKTDDIPPCLKLPVNRVNSSLFYVVNETPFETVNL